MAHEECRGNRIPACDSGPVENPGAKAHFEDWALFRWTEVQLPPAKAGGSHGLASHSGAPAFEIATARGYLGMKAGSDAHTAKAGGSHGLASHSGAPAFEIATARGYLGMKAGSDAHTAKAGGSHGSASHSGAPAFEIAKARDYLGMKAGLDTRNAKARVCHEMPKARHLWEPPHSCGGTTLQRCGKGLCLNRSALAGDSIGRGDINFRA